MRAYGKVRIVLFALLLGAAVAVTSAGWAADSGAGDGSAPAAAEKKRVNPFAIILQNIDFVFIIIMGCSVVGVTLMIQGFIKARRTVLIPESSNEQIRAMIEARQFRELIEFTETDPSFVSKALNPALKRAPSFSAMKEAMETAVAEQTADQFRKIEYLNIIGNLGPLLGLLGTVLGMIESFQRMNLSGGQANPSDLAGGISQALCHTMLGLLLAIPCLAAFGILRTFIDRLTVEGALKAEELLLMIKPQEAKPGVRPGVAAPVVPGIRKAPMPVPPPVPAQ